ncbi:MAG: ATP-binding protein [Candidatus Omnitrophota bacterium]
MVLNYFSIPPFIGAVLLFSIGVFVLMSDIHSSVRRLLFFLTTSTFVWLAGYALMYSLPRQGKALICGKILYIAVIFIPVFFHHFTLAYFKKARDNRYVILLTYAIGVIFVCQLFFSDTLISGVKKFFWGYHIKTGKLHYIYMLFFAACFVRCLYLLWTGYQKALKHSHAEANRVKYLFWAFFVSTIAATDFLPDYGISYYPLGFIFMSGWVIITAYAILRHRLMDIEVVIRKTFVFSMLFISSFLVISCFVYAQSLFFEHSGLNIWLSLIPAVGIIVLIGRPFESFLKRVTDRYLFQKKYDYKKLLASFSNEVLFLINKEELLKLSVTKLVDVVKVYSAGILLDDLNGQMLPWTFYDGKRCVERYELWSGEMKTLFGMHDKYRILNRNEPGNDIPQAVLEIGACMLIPLRCSNKTIGILALGAKKSDEDFTEDDISILLPICKTLAIAIANAELIKKLTEANARAAQNEKMAVIGMLSAGINHEICNPLGIARGKCESFLSNTREGFYRGEEPEELIRKAEGILESVIAETDRAAVITKRLSSFASPATGEDVEDVDISSEIEGVLEFLRYDLNIDRIVIEKRVEDNIPRVRGDRKGIQEIFFNILRNAIQAIENDGKIEINIYRSDGGVSVDINDTGKGMSRGVKDRIFSPFFTTKGVEKGTGLGLFIVRQIIVRNNGSIKIKSQEGIGTEVCIRFINGLTGR